MNQLELLHAIPVFSQLSTEYLALLAANLGVQRFARGDTIFHQGSAGNMLYIIVSGQVRIYTISVAGQQLSMMIFRSGDFFGELSLLDGQPRSANAEAMCATTTLMLHRQKFLDTVANYPLIATSVLEALATRLRQTTVYAEHLASYSAPQRVVQQLLDLAGHYGVPEDDATRIDLHMTQDDLASLAGTTRETVNRVLASLRDQGIIRVGRAQVSVLNMAQLQRSRERWSGPTTLS